MTPPAWYSQSDYKALKKESCMNQYKEIHLIDFPKNTTIMLDDHFRKNFIHNFIDSFNSWKDAIEYLNTKSTKYCITSKVGVGVLSHWFYGIEKVSGKTRRIPLWAIIEISARNDQPLKEVENNIIDCCVTGRGTPVKINFPIYLTPELVSIAFHLYGDGYLGGKGKQSHYRQVNKRGLNNFAQKLKNCFGTFEIKISEKSKIAIPKVLSVFLDEYLELGDCHWNKSRISIKIKSMSNDFLLAGLNAFIVDEGHIGETIEIYSGNKNLLKDIKEITNKLKYLNCNISEKQEKTGKMYRVRISLKNAQKFLNDCKKLETKFSTCGLAHKEHLLKEIVERQNRKWKRRAYGITQEMILDLLSNQNLNSLEFRNKLQICGSTLREHLAKLEAQSKIQKIRPEKSCCLIWSKVE